MPDEKSNNEPTIIAAIGMMKEAVELRVRNNAEFSTMTLLVATIEPSGCPATEPCLVAISNECMQPRLPPEAMIQLVVQAAAEMQAVAAVTGFRSTDGVTNSPVVSVEQRGRCTLYRPVDITAPVWDWQQSEAITFRPTIPANRAN